ncbi:GGDEF domain-containing protein [Tsukamurella soli]|uniref:GGDEF domain-containing protein n=1 Tax=Tsukamurella soli TaxID=644556 RepID=UPI0031F0F3D7
MRTAGRLLFSRRRWREAGVREYRFATEALDWIGWPLGLLRWALCTMCLATAALGAVMEFHPYGPRGPVLRTIHVSFILSSVVVAALWATRPWPSRRWAIAFVVWADIGIAIDGAVLSQPEARICATIHLSMIGLFAGFLLGWRILLAHCAFCVALIAALAVWAVLGDHRSLLVLYIYLAPALTTDVAMPAVVQAVVEGGRVAARRITVTSYRDPLTGLLNRRGLTSFAESLSAGVGQTGWVMVAVIDLDGFKELNDARGHEFGDKILAAAARRLLDAVEDDGAVARTGGDEFVVIASVQDEAAMRAMADRCVLRLLRADDPLVTSSVGVAGAPWGTASFEELQLDADVAMYSAKRAGRSQSVVSTVGYFSAEDGTV